MGLLAGLSMILPGLTAAQQILQRKVMAALLKTEARRRRLVGQNL